MATLTLPTDTVMIDSDLYAFLTDVKTNIDAMYGSAPVVVTDAASYAVLAANTGRVHVFPDLSQTTTATLPAKAAGLQYEFWYGGAAAEASNWVITAGATNGVLKGGVVFMDQDTDVMAPVYANGSSHVALTAVTPEVGTRVRVVCDGTNWFLNGQVFSATACTIA